MRAFCLPGRQGPRYVRERLNMQGLTRYHVGIIITGCLLCFGTGTLVFNSWSVFMVPVSQELGISTGLFSLQPSVIYLSCALFSPAAGHLIERFDLKAVLTGASIAGAMCVALCSRCTHLWQFVALGVVEGFACSVLLFLMLPDLISRWFDRNMGTVVGICIAMTGAGGATWAYVGGLVMVQSSWRAAYLVLGFAALVVSLFPCMFLLHNRPQDVGTLPFGAPLAPAGGTAPEDNMAAARVKAEPAASGTLAESSACHVSGIPANKALKTSTFALYSVAIGLVTGIVGLSNLLPTYVYHLGGEGFFSMTSAQLVIAASTVALCTQIAQASFKVAMGVLADRNVTAAFVIAMSCCIAAIFCFLEGYAAPAVVFAGGALFGASSSVVDVLSPVLMRTFFGDLQYTKIYARFILVVTMVPAFAIVFFSFLSNISWVATFLVAFASLMATLALGLAAMQKSKRLKELFVTA